MQNNKQDPVVMRAREGAISRLCITFRVPEPFFRAQLDRLLPIAQHFFLQGFSSLVAFRMALEKTSGKNRAAYPIDYFLPVATPWAAWAMSSSGVEQTLSLRKWINSPRRGMGAQYELDLVTIAKHNKPSEVQTIIEKAREVWANHYGNVRVSKKRLRGWKRKKADADHERTKVDTKEQFLKRRRAETKEALMLEPTLTSTAVKELALAKAGDTWTESHQREADRQVAQRRLRLLEAGSQNLLVPSELDTEVVSQITAWKEHQDKKRVYRDNHILKKNTMLHPRCDADVDLFGKTVHIEAGILAPEAVSAALVKTHMKRAGSPNEAAMFVMTDPSTPGPVRLWCAVLLKAHLADSHFFVSGGKKGCRLMYTHAPSVKKYIWMSDNFVNDFKPLFDVLKCALAKPKCQWKALPTVDELLAKLHLNIRN